MFADGYGFFASCRKIACLAILLAYSSSAQAISVTTPVEVTVQRPADSSVSFQVKVRVLDSDDTLLSESEITAMVTRAPNMPPKIVSVVGCAVTTVFTVSTNLKTLRFPVDAVMFLNRKA